MLEIRTYTDKKGAEPFKQRIADLRDRTARAKIVARIDRMRAGNLGDHRSVGGGVIELRVDFGPGYRIYFGRLGDVIVVLLIGGDKRTQSADIIRARNLWTDYRGRLT
jgi:putative addiction module killer protein